jgi:hypothetical protein
MVRQHVNPLSRFFQLERPLPPPAELFANPAQPIQLDIVCGAERRGAGAGAGPKAREVKKQLAQTYELSYNHDMSSYLGLNIQRNRSKKQVPSKLSHSMATAASPSNLTRNACSCDANSAVTCRPSKTNSCE